MRWIIKFSLEINQEVQTELNKSLKRNCIIALVIGIIGFVAYISISMFFEHFILEVLLWVFAFAFGFGLVFLITINKTNKKVVASKMVGEYELFEEFMTIDSIKDGEKISSAKVYYKDIIKIKETENYIFLYPNKQIAYPIPKNKLSAEELSTVKLWVHSAKIKK